MHSFNPPLSPRGGGAEVPADAAARHGDSSFRRSRFRDEDFNFVRFYDRCRRQPRKELLREGKFFFSGRRVTLFASALRSGEPGFSVWIFFSFFSLPNYIPELNLILHGKEVMVGTGR